jgi:hypothetical protein
MSLNHDSVLCPICHSESVDVISEPVVTHTPSDHGWYGQVHAVQIPMKCDCGKEFTFLFTAYKSRAEAKAQPKGES